MRGHQTRYRLLAQLRVRHEYFRDARPRQLVFAPADSTLRTLERFELLVRERGDGLDLVAPDTQLDLLWAELQDGRVPRQLCWQLRSLDPLFALYTEQRPPQQLLLDLLTPQADGSPPADPPWQDGLALQQDLHIKARRCTWKYLLLGDWNTARPSLLDSQGRVEFSADAEPELLPDGRRARVFRSRRRLPLVEQDSAQQFLFEVRDLSSYPTRLLLARLPLAAPRGLHIERRQGRSRPVSEIFVNR